MVLMNSEDMRARGIEPDQMVEVTTEIGSTRVRARPFDIAPRCACMYYPEVNRIVPRAVDGRSRTPAFKAVRILIETVESPNGNDQAGFGATSE